jgi:hypothetical protein
VFLAAQVLVAHPADPVAALEQAGYVRALGAWRRLTPGVGGTATLSIVPRDLAPRYDGRVAPGLTVFFTLRPARHRM